MAPRVDSLDFSLQKDFLIIKNPQKENIELFASDSIKENVDTAYFSNTKRLSQSENISTNDEIDNQQSTVQDNKKGDDIGKVITGVVAGAALIGSIALLIATKGKAKAPKIKDAYAPFKKSELKSVRKELQAFVDKEFATQVNITQKPKVVFYSKTQGHGMADPLCNQVLIQPEVLTSKDFCKLIDKTSGKVIDDSDVLWQMTGSRSLLEELIKGQKLKNVEILPLTREERLKVLKSTVAHESFHCKQFENMILHPNIGLEKMLKDFLEPFMKTKGFKYNMISAIGKRSWKSLLKTGKKLDPNSELAKRTMKQYRGLIFAKRNKNESLKYKIYTTLPTEKEAYRLEREFAIDNNLLL